MRHAAYRRLGWKPDIGRAVCHRRLRASGGAQITFDNGGSVIVAATAEDAAARIGEGLEALSSGGTGRD